MFIRRSPGRKGAMSIQIVEKVQGRIKVLKTVGTSAGPNKEAVYYERARNEVNSLSECMLRQRRQPG